MLIDYDTESVQIIKQEKLNLHCVAFETFGNLVVGFYHVRQSAFNYLLLIEFKIKNQPRKIDAKRN